jgi:hypothetical protein
MGSLIGLIQAIIGENAATYRDQNKQTLEMMLKSGGDFSSGTLQQISNKTGIPIEALQGIATSATINPDVANSPEDVKTLNSSALNERHPITSSEYDKQFGSGGSQVTYNLPSSEDRANMAEVARIQQIAQPMAEAKKLEIETTTPAEAARTKSIKKADIEAGLELNDQVIAATIKQHEAIAAQNEKDAEKYFPSQLKREAARTNTVEGIKFNYDAKIKGIEASYAKQLKAMPAGKQEESKESLNLKRAQTLEHLSNASYHQAMADFTREGGKDKQTLVKFTDVLKAAVASGLAKQKGKEGVELIDVEVGSKEYKTLKGLFNAAGLETDEIPQVKLLSPSTWSNSQTVKLVPKIMAPQKKTPTTNGVKEPKIINNKSVDLSKGTPVKTRSGRPAVQIGGKVYYTDGK